MRPVFPKGIVGTVPEIHTVVGESYSKVFLQMLSTKYAFSREIIISSILNITFPDVLKMADLIPIFKKDKLFDKVNYRQKSIFTSFHKVYVKIV